MTQDKVEYSVCEIYSEKIYDQDEDNRTYSYYQEYDSEVKGSSIFLDLSEEQMEDESLVQSTVLNALITGGYLNPKTEIEIEGDSLRYKIVNANWDKPLFYVVLQ